MHTIRCVFCHRLKHVLPRLQTYASIWHHVYIFRKSLFWCARKCSSSFIYLWIYICMNELEVDQYINGTLPQGCKAVYWTQDIYCSADLDNKVYKLTQIKYNSAHLKKVAIIVENPSNPYRFSRFASTKPHTILGTCLGKTKWSRILLKPLIRKWTQ